MGKGNINCSRLKRYDILKTIKFKEKSNKMTKKKVIATSLDNPIVPEKMELKEEDEKIVANLFMCFMNKFTLLGELKSYQLPSKIFNECKQMFLERKKTVGKDRRKVSEEYTKLFRELREKKMVLFLDSNNQTMKNLEEEKQKRSRLVLGINSLVRKIEHGLINSILYDKNSPAFIVDLLLPLCRYRKVPIVCIPGVKSVITTKLGLRNGSHVFGILDEPCLDDELIELSKCIGEMYTKYLPSCTLVPAIYSLDEVVAENSSHNQSQDFTESHKPIVESIYLERKSDGTRAFKPEHAEILIEDEESFISLTGGTKVSKLKPMRTLIREFEPKNKKMKQ